MTAQQENEAILLSHAQIKSEFIPHDGSTIADLSRIVEKHIPTYPASRPTIMTEAIGQSADLGTQRQNIAGNDWQPGQPSAHSSDAGGNLTNSDAPRERVEASHIPEICPVCGGYGEVTSRGYESDRCEVEICKQCQGKGSL
jgi:hypothetical protein